MLVKNADIGHRSTLDVRIDGGLITELGPALDRSDLDVLDAAGGAVIPGLTDHHLHLHALAAATSSIRCGPPHVRTAEDLAVALSRATPDDTGWIRGVGYIETVAGELDRQGLDHLHSRHPVRIQHRSGAFWILNTVAGGAAGLATAHHPGIERLPGGQPTGRVWRADTWLRSRLPDSAPPNLREIGRHLSRYGLTSVTDATPDLANQSLRSIDDAVVSGDIRQNICLLGAPLEFTPVRSGQHERLTYGPYKIVIADSALPDLGELEALIESVHRTGRAVAVHSVSIPALVLLLAAFDATGTVSGDRIEHASIVPDDCVPRLRQLGVRVVTQPGFIADRGDDYLRDVDARDLPGLYRCRSLLDASVPVALSSDAPYGPLDPWTVISAAVRRQTISGAVVGRGERLAARAALDAYLAPAHDPGGPPRRIAVGEPADFVVLDAPLDDVLDCLSSELVVQTFIAGARV